MPVLTRWLDLFPESIIQTHAGLLIAQIFLFSLRWDMAATSASIDRATWLAQEDRSVTDERRQLRLAVTDALRAHLLYRQGDASHAIPLFERSLNNLWEPAAYSFVHAQVIQFLALSYAECGRREEGLALLQTALAEATAYQHPTIMILLGSQLQIHLFSGELSEAADIAEHLLAVAESSQAHTVWSGEGAIELWRGWAHHFLALIAYERDELEAATRHWQAVETMHHRVNPGAYQAGLIGLALIALAQRATTTALAYGQAVHELALKTRSSPFFVFAGALEMRLALSSGAIADALHRAREIDTSVNQSNTFWPEPPQLSVLRVLLAEGTTASLQTALQLCETCLREAEDAHNIRQIIPLLALQALLWHALRNRAKAFDALKRALALGEPGGFTRTFLDLGAPMAELLQLYECQRGSSACIKRLLAAFASGPDRIGRHELTARYVRLHGITPPTRRELEVLTLAAQHLTIAAMAEQLVISPHTVKKHLSNIYAKLGVNSRRQAMTKAIEVGLLPPM